jgi:hypothetical protein
MWIDWKPVKKKKTFERLNKRKTFVGRRRRRTDENVKFGGEYEDGCLLRC